MKILDDIDFTEFWRGLPPRIEIRTSEYVPPGKAVRFTGEHDVQYLILHPEDEKILHVIFSHEQH